MLGPNPASRQTVLAEGEVSRCALCASLVTGGGVAVEVDGAGFFENAAEFDEARSHHGEVGEHVGAAEEGSEGAHGFGDAAALFDDGLVGAGGLFVPLPCVFEGGDLGGGAGAVLFREEDVVVLAGVEGRVEG